MSPIIVMPDPASLGIFVAAALVLLLTPGPAVLYIVTRSVDQGRRDHIRQRVVGVAKEKTSADLAGDKKRPKPVRSVRIQTTASFWNVPG